jgi:hypothetical protein
MSKAEEKQNLSRVYKKMFCSVCGAYVVAYKPKDSPQKCVAFHTRKIGRFKSEKCPGSNTPGTETEIIKGD